MSNSASGSNGSFTESDTYDYVIVGGGSAGCVLANRLSADPGVRVLLIEAGPDEEPFWVRTPAGVGNVFFDARINWKFQTEEEPLLAGRRLYWPRGKVIGGSSAINGMVYVRGQRTDYDGWARQGCVGWGWDDVLPYFKKAESSDLTDGSHRGTSGPLRVSRPAEQHPATEVFVKAGMAAGLPFNPDITNGVQHGVGYLQHTIGDGLRSSTARAYLGAIRNRKNLTVLGNATVHGVIVEGDRAVGVRYKRESAMGSVRVRREVILSAGAIGSPHILMLSGIGHGDGLRDKGIPVVRHLPGVGSNLHDHLAVNAGYETVAGMSLNPALRGIRKFANGARYLLTKKGPLAVGVSHAVAFVHSAPDVEAPDIQISFRPLSLGFDDAQNLEIHPFPGIQFAGCILRPQSRGSIELATADAMAAPRIKANYLSAPADQKVGIELIKWIRRIAGSAPLKDLIRREDVPGAQFRTDEDLLDCVRKQSQTLYHPVGTCRMGEDVDAVVDSRLRVKGIRGLRVVDASIMPAIVSGNTNAPTIMIGEKGADMIIEDARKA